MVCVSAAPMQSLMLMSRKRVVSPHGRLALYVVLSAVCVALDQLCKAFMRGYLADGPKPFIPGVLQLQLIGNTGAAFSIGEGKQLLFVCLALAVFVGCAVWVFRDTQLPLALIASLSCVAGGGLGNMVDRLASGVVTDFFATEFMSFPIFNVADIFVTVGVVVSFLLWWRYDSQMESRLRAPQSYRVDLINELLSFWSTAFLIL